MENNNATIDHNKDKSCLICFGNISTQKWVVCVICNIILHATCEEQWRGEKGYCKCPHCQRIGTLGMINNET